MGWNGSNARAVAALAIVLALALGLLAAPASAAKPSWAGGGKEKHARSSEKQDRESKADSKPTESGKTRHVKHFRKQDEDAVRHHYREELRDGKDCPPGLARKNNGCTPPGHARKQWTAGRPLASDVVSHDLPRELLSRLPEPPRGQRYVRVLSDILLVERGSDVVIDAIVDLATR